MQRRGARRDRRAGVPVRAGALEPRAQPATAPAARRASGATSSTSSSTIWRSPGPRRRTSRRPGSAVIGILPTLGRRHLVADALSAEDRYAAAQRADAHRPRRADPARHRPAATRSATGAQDRLPTSTRSPPRRRARRCSCTCRCHPDVVRGVLERGAVPGGRAAGGRRELAVPARRAAVGGDPDPAVRAVVRRAPARAAQPGRPATGVVRRAVDHLDPRPVRARTAATSPACSRSPRSSRPVGRAGRGAVPALSELQAAQRHDLALEPAGVRRGGRAAAHPGGEPGAARRSDARSTWSPTPCSSTGCCGCWSSRIGRCGARCRSRRRRRTSPAAARIGLDAPLYWPGTGWIRPDELVLRKLLPMAAEGWPAGGRRPGVRPLPAGDRAALPAASHGGGVAGRRGRGAGGSRRGSRTTALHGMFAPLPGALGRERAGAQLAAALLTPLATRAAASSAALRPRDAVGRPAVPRCKRFCRSGPPRPARSYRRRRRRVRRPRRGAGDGPRRDPAPHAPAIGPGAGAARLRTENSHARPQPLLVIPMSPFRLFGPPPEPEPAVAAHDDSGGVTWAAGRGRTIPPPPPGTHARSASTPGPHPASAETRLRLPPVTALRRPVTTTRRPIRSGSRRSLPIRPRPGRRRPGRGPPSRWTHHRIHGRRRLSPGPSPRTTCRGTKTTPVGAAGSWPATWPPPRAIPRCSAGTGRAGSARSSPCRVRFARTGTTACWSTSGCGSRPTAPWVVARPTNPNPDPTGRFRGCLPSHRHRSGRAGRAARRTGSG